MISLHLVLLILAMVCFAAAAVKIEPQRVSLTPLGLFFWALSLLL